MGGKVKRQIEGKISGGGVNGRREKGREGERKGGGGDGTVVSLTILPKLALSSSIPVAQSLAHIRLSIQERSFKQGSQNHEASKGKMENSDPALSDFKAHVHSTAAVCL